MSAPVSVDQGAGQIREILEKARVTTPETDEVSQQTSETEEAEETIEDPIDDPALDEEREQDPGPDDVTEEITEDDTESEEDGVISTFADLAREFDADETTVMESIVFDNGFGQEVSVAEAVNAYRDGTNGFLAKAAELEQAYSARETKLSAQMEDGVKQVAALAKVLADELQADFAGADMEQLKATDPLRFAELIEKRQRRQALIGDALKAMDGESARRAQRGTEAVQGEFDKQAALLRQKRPAWFKPDANGNVPIAQIVDENQAYMKAAGYSDERIASVTDHLDVITLWEAAQWRKSQQSAEGKTLSKVREKKGLKRPGMGKRAAARAEPTNQRETARKEGLQRVRKTARLDDGAAAIRSMLKKT